MWQRDPFLETKGTNFTLRKPERHQVAALDSSTTALTDCPFSNFTLHLTKKLKCMWSDSANGSDNQQKTPLQQPRKTADWWSLATKSPTASKSPVKRCSCEEKTWTLKLMFLLFEPLLGSLLPASSWTAGNHFLSFLGLILTNVFVGSSFPSAI